MKREVSLAIPCAQVVEPKTLRSIAALAAHTAGNGIKIHDVGVTERIPIDDARNLLAEKFLQTSTEWIFWMDSDMTFPKDTLVKLFKVAEEKNAKMVSGVYYQRKGMNYPVLWSRGEVLEESGQETGLNNPRGKTNKYMGTFIFPHKDKKEPFKAHAAGYGCVLVHRSIFEIMPRPWFQFIKGQCSEDFYFFVNAHELGFDLWIEPTIKLGHLGDSPEITVDDFWKNGKTANLELDVIKQ